MLSSILCEPLIKRSSVLSKCIVDAYFEHTTISSNIGYMSGCGSILHPPSPSSGRGRGWRQRDWLMTGRGGCRLIWPGTRLQARPREGCTSSSSSGMQCASLFSSVTPASRQQNETADSWKVGERNLPTLRYSVSSVVVGKTQIPAHVLLLWWQVM